MFFITARPSNEQYEVTVASALPEFFPLVEEVFNLIKKIDTEEKYEGQDFLDKDSSIVSGRF